jgi:hypothetical protein
VACQDLTLVRRFHFSTDLRSGECTLELELAESEQPDSRAAVLIFSGVSQLSLTDFGGGVTQLLCLRATDIRDKQLDRLNLSVSDVERNSISFLCQSAQVSPSE